MKSEVYIGINGIGKSKKLKEFIKNNKDFSLFIQYSEKNSAPDTNVLDKNNIVIDQFQKFLEKLFTLEIEIELEKLPEDFQKKLKIINKNIKNEEEINNIWKKIKDDTYITFLDKINSFIKPEKNINIFKIAHTFYSFDLSKWKMTTNDGIKNHGTGKLAYFQIKFLYEHLELIPKENIEQFYLIIDEPELFLHTSMKKHVGFMLKKINEKINVVIATHSIELLNSFYQFKSTKIFSKKTWKEKDWLEIKIVNNKIHNFVNRKIYFELLMSKKIIICEGNNDVKLINHILNNKKNIEQDVLVVSSLDLKKAYTGKSDIPSIFNLIKHVKIKSDSLIEKDNVFILYDRDEENTNDNKEIEKLNNKNIFGFKNNLEEYFGIKEKQAWDEYGFFEKEENKQKLEDFMKKSKLSKFLLLTKKQTIH